MTQIPVLEPLAKPKTKDFIEAYTEYSTNLASADELYHLSQGLFVTSVCVGRTPIIITPEPKYPNINTVLLGWSRFVHKSTVMNMALRVLPDEANSVPGNWTVEAMNKRLAETERKNGRGEVWYHIDEWGTVLAGLNKMYMSQLKQFMMSWDDCKSGGRLTIGRGEEECERPYVCSTTATTLEVFIRFIKREDIESGFLARKLVVVGDIVPLKPREFLTPEDEQREQSLKHWTTEIYKVFHERGEDGQWLDNKCFKISEDALEYYNELEKQIHDKAMKKPAEIPSLIMTQAYLENALKIAPLVTVARKSIEELKGSNEIVVEFEDMQRAVKLAERFEKSAKKSIELLVKNVYDIVLEKIPFEPDKISRSDLSKAVYRIAKADRLNTILRTGTTAGEIMCDTIKTKSEKTGREYPTRFYWRPHVK